MAVGLALRGVGVPPGDSSLYVAGFFGDSLQMRPGECGRDYRVLSVALLEVTFCAFPQSVSDIVMTNIAANVPGH